MSVNTDRAEIEIAESGIGNGVFIPQLRQIISLACGYGALAVVATYFQTPAFVSSLVGTALAAALIYLSTIDIAQFRLPDAITLPLLAAGLVLAALGGTDVLVWHALSAVLAFASFWSIGYLYGRLRGMVGLGLGDAKLLAAAGAWVGGEHLAMLVLIAAVTALGYVALLTVRGQAIDRDVRLAFGPFLAVAFWWIWLTAVGQS